MKNCIVAQSGGPTVAINASVAGVLSGNEKTHIFDTVYGGINGIEGILHHNIVNLSEKIAEDPDFIRKLSVTPAMYLGSCRFKMPKATDNAGLYEELFSYLEELDIDTFFYVGGNDSMDTVLQMSRYAAEHDLPVKVLGIPKTIDNDLVITDHTPGFGSCAKYAATTLLEVAHDAYIYPMKTITVVELMGRDAGWITAASALARTSYSAAPHLIYLPERPFSKEQCIADVKKCLETTDDVILAVSEGIRDKDGNYISATGTELDKFGHVKLAGAGNVVGDFLKEAFALKVRVIELNVLQRAAAHIASAQDQKESMELGEHAVTLACQGVTGHMVTFLRKSDSPYTYEISSHDISDIANAVKEVPDAYINEAGNDVTDAFLAYARPLIQGTPELTYKDGLPEYAFL